tara:strand:+ start:1271 stop:1780 length:510 start_codon:yes stop_codon:yes gene_type:complete
MDLKIYVPSKNQDTIAFYKEFIGNNALKDDSGLDIPICCEFAIKTLSKGVLIPLGVHIIAFKNDKRVPYILCSRSSTPINTPLRLANGIGIIDKGYNGELKAVVDHCGSNQGHNASDIDKYIIKPGDRLFQIIDPTLEPIKSIQIIDSLDNYMTERNDCGFGSTGVNIS